MSTQVSFLDRKLTNVVSEMGGQVLQTLVVPNRKMNVVLVGVPTHNNLVSLHVFGVRKADGVISSRFDTPRLVTLRSTTLYQGEGATPVPATRFERAQMRAAVKGRISRNFFRKVVGSAEFQAEGLAYYKTLTEPNYYLELSKVVDELNGRVRAEGYEVTIPEWSSVVRYQLDGQSYSCHRTLRYQEKHRQVVVECTFFAGPKPGTSLLRGRLEPANVRPGESVAALTLVKGYPEGNWRKVQEFVDEHVELIRAYIATTKATLQ